jgi:adenosylmethionine-8-amino-7-oxononanoate aminotransferase
MVLEKQQVADEVAKAHATAYEEPIYREALEHVWIHGGNWSELAEKQGLHVFERGEGIHLYDARGKEWIDGIAGLWVVNAGHGRREIGEAMAEQAGKVAYASRRATRPSRRSS